jgi:hypothetical protein
VLKIERVPHTRVTKTDLLSHLRNEHVLHYKSLALYNGTWRHMHSEILSAILTTFWTHTRPLSLSDLRWVSVT